MAPRDLADWSTRVRAFLLDQLIVGVVALAAVLVVVMVVGDPGSRGADVAAYAIAVPLGLLYAPLLMARRGERNGQTLGKQLVGIRVVRTDGEPMTFWVGVVRWVFAQQLLIAITFYLYALVDYLWPLGDAQRQALHDKIAKTWVVPTAARPSVVLQPTAAPPSAPEARTEEPIGGWLPPRAPGA